jgi:transcriptional regulator with XRE-family HTH domain
MANETRLRVTKLRKALGLTQARFGKKLGLSDVSISLIESGKNTLTEQNIKLICLTFGVNETWLRTGDGEIFNEAVPGEQQLLDLFRNLSPPTKKMILSLARTAFENDQAMQGRGADDDVPDEQAGEKATNPIHEQARA